MRRFVIALVLMLGCLPCWADHVDTCIEWRDWSISSNENLYTGKVKHTSHPLTYLVDGDTKTAWVFSGDKARIKAEGLWTEPGKKEPGTFRESINIRGATVADSLWIMNGYNKSPEVFRRNNRITQVSIYRKGKLLKTANLKDRMGWHRIALPRQPIWNMQIVFTGIRKGTDDDTCISEISLYDGKRKIDFNLPKMVLYTDGDECGCGTEYSVMTRAGKQMFTSTVDEDHDWNPSGRLLAGTHVSKDGRTSIWAVDVVKGKVIRNKPIRYKSKKPYSERCEIEWTGERSLLARVYRLERGHKLMYKETVRL